MESNTKRISSYVRMRLMKWEKTEEKRTRAELAELRRGIGRKPGELPAIWAMLFEGLPEELMSRSGEASRAEWAVATALTMYALHQQGREIGDGTVYKEGSLLGRAVGELASDEKERERIRKRFNVFATAADIEGCAYYLRGLVQLLRGAGIPLDYPALAADLYQYQMPDGAAGVRLRWGQDFYRVVNRKNGESRNEK